ncbi:hypothetical protein JL49_24320 [Pseudoalteromonas luteoviolacea]|uniref:Uncharacterized protein n=1 Tax=Pseudoalteromonas luteoviolacea NCIMB 1942 TaxID=1365253 RepID=A0A167AY95_9GAMM|nr:hypothetical protein N482_13405 [Pseudoalteromonas luteoviolacea NCIMB 1942]KZW98272.1 hypothetical protein JL49_24320 [Pseudoalteromonas luteoviolacea]
MSRMCLNKALIISLYLLSFAAFGQSFGNFTPQNITASENQDWQLVLMSGRDRTLLKNMIK